MIEMIAADYRVIIAFRCSCGDDGLVTVAGVDEPTVTIQHGAGEARRTWHDDELPSVYVIRFCRVPPFVCDGVYFWQVIALCPPLRDWLCAVHRHEGRPDWQQLPDSFALRDDAPRNPHA